MCVDLSQNTIKITNYLGDMESFSTLLNKFCIKGLNPSIFRRLKERPVERITILGLIKVPKQMIGTVFAIIVIDLFP